MNLECLNLKLSIETCCVLNNNEPLCLGQDTSKFELYLFI